jgi:hypothetical protein
MSDLERHTLIGDHDAEAWMAPDPDGMWVLHSAVVEALAQAEQRGYERGANEVKKHLTDPVSYQMGQRDALANLDNAEVWGRIMKVLNDNGINTENGSIHSWRCFDKERYPEPCSCAAEVVVEIIQAVKGDG